MIDKAEVVVTGHFGAGSDLETVALLLREYADALKWRAQRGATQWKAPSGRDSGKIAIRTVPDPQSTIAGAKLTAALDLDHVALRLTVTTNPTRTLRHKLETLPRPSLDDLWAMPSDQFFAATATLSTLRDLDKGDNLLPDLNAVLDWLGPNYASCFLEVFEHQLRRWALEALAPVVGGFEHHTQGDAASLCSHALTMNWARVTLSSVEGYFERRHARAKDLMSRIEKQVTASHAEAAWRAYTDFDIGGRQSNSMVVGTNLTQNVVQVVYAKTKDRVRVEMRFKRAVRNTLQMQHGSNSTYPLTDLLSHVRNFVVKRTKWPRICDMASEPERALLEEVAQMMGAIARCAKAARVAPDPIFMALMTTGGISENDDTSPRRLMWRLAGEGLISTESLKQRMQPGERRRHALVGDWRDIVNRLQTAFGSRRGT